MTVDGVDVTSKSKVLSSKVWYTPEEPFQDGDHSVTVVAKDHHGNSQELAWSFRLNAAEGGEVQTGARGKLAVALRDAVTRAFRMQ